MYIVSACLIGLETRYDGSHQRSEHVVEEIRKGYFIPLCPEQLGGLPTPREPAFIKGGDGLQVLKGRARVINKGGIDVTEQFLKGAYEVLKMANAFGARVCLLKDGSPSCGVHMTYGEQGKMPGCGVLTAILMEEGFKVVAIE